MRVNSAPCKICRRRDYQAFDRVTASLPNELAASSLAGSEAAQES